ncbi:Hypothetical protein CINCED_3A007846 [Cinara cedri]|uniref:Uncharacterized protein n=1 Tax=Cinara cedri TaxID=506608 RepID=A0A5E4N7Q3_9HEMI|nr:Hypothetical protein CINCED_3A007846 [Cinara cedri]
MTEENFKTVKSSFVDNSQTIIIKINQQIRFTKVQIEKLLKLQLLNMDIQKCISSVASTLKLENIEANELHFWLADTIAGVVKNIEQKGVSIIQGIIIICWFIHYVSLVIEEKCSMAKLFENLCECVKIALANANEYYNIVPLPTHTECLLKFETDNYSSSTSVKSAKKTESRSTVTAVQVMKIITTVIRET